LRKVKRRLESTSGTQAQATLFRRKAESQKGIFDILLFYSPWPASRSKGRVKPEFCSRFRLPLIVPKRRAASKALTQRLEFGFCFHPVEMASPLSGLENWTVVQQAIRATASDRFQAGPLPILAPLHHVGPKRISLHVTQHGQRVFIGLNRKSLESSLPDKPAAIVVPMATANA
jgi:hypothetical protein